MFDRIYVIKAKLRAAIRAVGYSGKEYCCGAIITAAGNSTRMNAGYDKKISKQLASLNGQPVISYSLRAFDESEFCREIVISVKNDEKSEIEELLKNLKIKTKVTVVIGGSSRSISVANGFRAISKDCKYIAIHDGARPLIKTDDIDTLYKKAFQKGASCASTKVCDTLKRADNHRIITETVDRENLYAVQTPQVFSKDIYLVALALAKGKEFTDDCGLVQNAGFKIPLVDIGNENIKLTTRNDFYLAEAILSIRDKSKE